MTGSDPRERDEYRALRATVQGRGTARVLVFALSLTAWAALAVTTAVLWPVPAATLFPLLVLAAGFEAVFALHVGVERIGRYLQVFHDDRWERTAMEFGAPMAGTGTDPLFTAFFAVATMLNFAPVLLANAVAAEQLTRGAAHLLVLTRIVLARRAAARQRAADRSRFEQLKSRTHV
jgi:hypothetical protein